MPFGQCGDRAMTEVSDLVRLYREDPDSPLQKVKYKVRVRNIRLLDRIERECGATQLASIKGPAIKGWHRRWRKKDKTAIAHLLVGQLRALFRLGLVLEVSPECKRLLETVDRLRIDRPVRCDLRLTTEQVNAIRRTAHAKGWHSIALGQALQFELLLRQKDVIGEWKLPNEGGGSVPRLVIAHGRAWTDGLCWEEISEDLVLAHATSAREGCVRISLSKATMVMEELALVREREGHLPSQGPMVLCEATRLPWIASEYRRKWRILADAVGVPKRVKNRSSRSGVTLVRLAGRDFWTFERQRPK
jgi:hypothetical protein